MRSRKYIYIPDRNFFIFSTGSFIDELMQKFMLVFPNMLTLHVKTINYSAIQEMN